MRPQIGHQSVFNFLVGLEDRVLVRDHQLPEACILKANIVDDSTIVEQFHWNDGRTEPLKAEYLNRSGKFFAW